MVRATAEKFPRWVDQTPGVAASTIEAWVYESSTWTPIPFQVDEVGDRAADVKPFIDPEQFSGAQCVNITGPPPPDPGPGPCEFQYDLRGESPPAGDLTTNDELVFLAGSAAACDAPTTSWPSSGLTDYRYRIDLKDDTLAGEERGCVYLFRRTSGQAPGIPDLVDYDPVGDGEAGRPGLGDSCRPAGTAACGAIVAPAYDVDGDGTADVPAYQMDFLGNWTTNKWFLGETCPPPGLCPGQDMVDFVKWRIDNPTETEQVWDLYTGETGVCGSFVGYIDGPVRVVRVIQGAASGAFTRKLEFAYPGEVMRRVYLRVHMVGGPIYAYFDLDVMSTSPVLSRAKVFRTDKVSEGDPYDVVDGQPTTNQQPGVDEWYQVSSDIGSFLTFVGEEKTSNISSRNGRYDDSSDPVWEFEQTLPDWDEQDGDYALSTTEWRDLAETENFLFCDDPREDRITPIHEDITVMLSSGRAASNAGKEEMERRLRGVLSRMIEEEQRNTPCCGGGNPCIPTLNVSYDRDGGPVESSTTTPGCGGLVLGWNLYQSLGAGVYRRLASLGPTESFSDVTLALNEQRTYRATALGPGGVETAMSSSVTVLHDDIVAPPPPEDAAAVAAGNAVTVSWDGPYAGDVQGYRVLVAEQSGGPYEQPHPGLLGPLAREHTFAAVGGNTYYVVVTAIDHAGNESDPSTEVSVAVP